MFGTILNIFTTWPVFVISPVAAVLLTLNKKDTRIGESCTDLVEAALEAGAGALEAAQSWRTLLGAGAECRADQEGKK